MKRFLRVFMDLNNKCNLRCRMCYFSLDLKCEPPVTMGLELFRKIAGEVFPRSLSVNLSCAAEPLIIPDYGEYLKVAEEHSVPETTIVTNALLLDEKMIRSIINSNISVMDISIDGAKKETYERIRKGSSFEKVLNNVRSLQKIKKIRKSKNPRLYLDYALMRSNIDEFPDFLRLAKELGADRVRANHLIPFERLDIMDESLIHCKEKTNRVLDEARKEAKELGLDIAIPKNFNLSKAKKKAPAFNRPQCRVPFESMFIISDGRVTPCAWFSLKEWCAGGFNKQGFGEIWNGDVYAGLRERFDRKEFTRFCQNCPVYGADDIENYVFKNRLREDVINISTERI
ncbi:radical SAM protein [Candidatus Omnitrophota bacterium]